MAVDRKADYVGNHGGSYTDNDGMSKQFTVIDHDKKTKISTGKQEKEDFTAFFIQYRKELINRILDIPASLCPIEYQDFTVRGDQATIVTWNQKMITDKGFDTWRLRNLAVILENRSELMGLTGKVIKT